MKDSATLTCTGGGTYYDQTNNACSPCATGCALCVVDFDYCTDCVSGYDWDKSSMKCVRATLGLAAVVLALSVITLIFGVIICLLSCKLWSSIAFYLSLTELFRFFIFLSFSYSSSNNERK